MAAESGGANGAADSAWSRLRRRLRVTTGLEDAGHATERIRATTLAVFVASCFVILGALHADVSGIPTELLEEFPVDEDLAMRTVSLGWFGLDGALPVTLVDIDERTWRDWNSPAVTPRAALVKLLQAVTSAAPAAVVVDVDLSWGSAPDGAASSGESDGDRALREFLASYAGPVIVLPKRVESGETGLPHPADSPFDVVVAGNPNVSWAHASFRTDGDGKVRKWRGWLAICTDTGGQWLPSVATEVTRRIEPLPQGMERPRPPGSAEWDCAGSSEADGGSEQRLLLGPRLSGAEARSIGSGARRVSAEALLDPEVARDDSSLFANRIVLIGATHESSGDHWLTTVGVLPGVELLANAVRYSALQAQLATDRGEGLRRLAALILFVLYALIDWRLRGVTRAFLAVVVTVVFVAVAIGFFEDLRAFEVVAAAVLVTVIYKSLESVCEFVAELREERGHHPAGLGGWLGAAWSRIRAAMLRPHATASGGGHDQH